jgi:hypothetical protein
MTNPSFSLSGWDNVRSLSKGNMVDLIDHKTNTIFKGIVTESDWFKKTVTIRFYNPETIQEQIETFSLV